MSYIFGKLWHLAIIWPIRSSFQCILQGVRFLLANHSVLSWISETFSYSEWLLNLIMNQSILWDLTDAISCSTDFSSEFTKSFFNQLNIENHTKRFVKGCFPAMLGEWYCEVLRRRTQPSGDVSIAHAQIAGTSYRHSGKQLFLLCWRCSVNPPLEQNNSPGDVKWCVCW